MKITKGIEKSCGIGECFCLVVLLTGGFFFRLAGYLPRNAPQREGALQVQVESVILITAVRSVVTAAATVTVAERMMSGNGKITPPCRTGLIRNSAD